jgi:hypothetical protein
MEKVRATEAKIRARRYEIGEIYESNEKMRGELEKQA